MTVEKFNSEVKTLKRFFEFYCDKKHVKQKVLNELITYKEKDLKINLFLCDECKADILYSISRLQECPHEIKPKCRKCPTPCYEKIQWKRTAKVMRYSGIRLKINSLFTQ